MRLLIQRVQEASVTINPGSGSGAGSGSGSGAGSGEKRNIGPGAVILLGIKADDTMETVEKMTEKLLTLRFREDAESKTNLSLLDTKGDLLIVSQFTLYADCSGGRRPSFIDAARPEIAIPLYEAFVEEAKKSGLKVETGEFGADMLVDIANDGPFTIWLDSEGA